MRKCCIFLMLLFASVMVQAKGNGIPSEIFKNGKVKYEKSTNTLVLEDGFMFSLGKGLVVFENGGCVFGLWAHYRYAYDEQGKIIFEETYNADYNTVDEWADLTLELFPPQYKGADFRDKAEKEHGDTTFCYNQWTPDGETSNYFGIRYDRKGNWFEMVHTSEDGYTCASVIVREIKYYKDIALFDLPVGVKAVSHQWKSDGRKWGNRYEFDREGNMTSFRSWVDEEALYEWTPADEELGSDFIVPGANDRAREVEYWSTAVLGELKTLPAGVQEKDAFYLCFDYMGYAFEGNLYPLHDGWWIVMSHSCPCCLAL